MSRRTQRTKGSTAFKRTTSNSNPASLKTASPGTRGDAQLAQNAEVLPVPFSSPLRGDAPSLVTTPDGGRVAADVLRGLSVSGSTVSLTVTIHGNVVVGPPGTCLCHNPMGTPGAACPQAEAPTGGVSQRAKSAVDLTAKLSTILNLVLTHSSGVARTLANWLARIAQVGAFFV